MPLGCLRLLPKALFSLEDEAPGTGLASSKTYQTVLDDPSCRVLSVYVTEDDYEDDEDEDVSPAAAGAKQPLSAAKDTVGKLAEKASSVAGVSAFPIFLLSCASLYLAPCLN